MSTSYDPSCPTCFSRRIALIPPERLANGLRVNEDAVLCSVSGGVPRLRRAYRIIARNIMRPLNARFTNYADVRAPKVSRPRFTALRERIEAMVLEAADYYAQPSPRPKTNYVRARNTPRRDRIWGPITTSQELAEQVKLDLIADTERGDVSSDIVSLSDLGDGNPYFEPLFEQICPGHDDFSEYQAQLDAFAAIRDPAIDIVDAWIKSGGLQR